MNSKEGDSTIGWTDSLFRRESARLIAAPTKRLGTHRLQLAEDVVQEALLRALQTWPYRGVPDRPGAWLAQTAKNLAIDFLRRERRWQSSEGLLDEGSTAPFDADEHDTFADDTLRMMFVCFHPQLSIEAQTGLALRTLCGLSPGEIAAAFLTSEATIAKRLVRARQRIRELAVPFTVPDPSDLPKRLDGVLSTLYLLFNEGYKASSGERLVREELCHEAIRLTALLTEHPQASEPRTFALLALMLFNGSRLRARSDDVGNLLRLHEQDRSAWDQQAIERGVFALGQAARGSVLSEYHLEAGIAACHSLAPNSAATDWPRILHLYDQLVGLTGAPIAGLNRSVAVARVHGPAAGLAALDGLTQRASLASYHLYHAIRGTFEAELGRLPQALTHFRQAGNLASLPAERDFIARRMEECSQGEGRV